MKRTAAEIAAHVNGELVGEGSTLLDGVAGLKNAGPRELAYAEEKFLKDAEASGAGCIVIGGGDLPGKTVIRVRNPKAAFARAAALLADTETHGPAIHPTAVIEADATIGENSRVGAGCTIGRGVKIGRDCVLHPRVVIYPGVEIGDRVILHAGTVIGADGFGYVWDGERQVKFPQAGGVLIEDDVEIGANSCVDRGSLGNTIIRRGVKIDNLVQVAHNVEIGEHTVVAAQTGISGSAVIGARSIVAGQVGIADHVVLDPGSIVGAQAGIPSKKHIRGGKVLWGTPARPLKQVLEQQAALARLPELIKEFRRRFRP